MPTFAHDGLTFNYAEAGTGIPFVFQHGFCADLRQPFSLFVPPPEVRLLAFDCRGHGETIPLGDESKLSFAAFADDLAVFLDHLQIETAVVGGTSMGAAVALAFALRYPQRVNGLVLSRPAWLAGPKPETVYWCTLIARLIREHGAARGRELFLQSPEYGQVRRQSPEATGPLLRQFEAPRAEEAVARLERIPPDAPCRSLDELKAIAVPALIMANRLDPVHPFEYGQILARSIPGADLAELTPKAVDPVRHTAEVQKYIEAFLRRHFAVA